MRVTRNEQNTALPNTEAPTPAGRLPDFLIIGAMKAGTTTLYEYLMRDSRLFLCSPKEPMYFSREAVYSRGEAWYRSLFASAGPEQLCGEASTCYSRAPHHSGVPERIAAAVPEVRLIYVLRHPVERAYSHYKWDLRNENLTGRMRAKSFEEALEGSSEYLDSSNYIAQIRRYLEHFPRDRLLVLLLDDLRRDPKPALDACQQHLGLERHALTDSGMIRANAEDSGRLAAFRIRKGIGKVRRLPGVRRVVDLLPRRIRRGGKGTLVNALAGGRLGSRIRRRHEQSISPLLPRTRAALLDQLEAPTRELAEFLGRELPESWYA